MSDKEWTTWNGGDSAPVDWDGGPVLLRDDKVHPADKIKRWDHYGNPYDIIGYQKRPATAPLPVQTAIAALLADGWTKRDDGTLVPPDPLADAREFVADILESWVPSDALAPNVRNGCYDLSLPSVIEYICKRFNVDKLPPAP